MAMIIVDNLVTVLNIPVAEIGEIWKVAFDNCVFWRSVLLPDLMKEIGGFTMVYQFSFAWAS